MEPPEAREIPPGMAGALLRAARESAGMTIDAAASHLKLAPRQVKAIEEGDYKELPGRTFIRGFVRNYARLVHLDPERVLAALPGGASAPALEAPTLSPTAPTMGELPTTEHAKTPWARWAIPAVLAAIVALAAVYEWMRPPGESHLASAPAETHGAAPKDLSPRAAPTVADAPSPPAAPAIASTPLPNPVASAPGADAAPTPAPDAPAATPQATAARGVAPSAPEPSVAPAATASGPAPFATPPAAAAAATTGPGAATPVGEQTVVIAFRDSSWTEIRDRDGRVLLAGMNRGGTAQTVSGVPPLTIRIGNAADVTLRYKGERVDLAPYTQRNVARLTLR